MSRLFLAGAALVVVITTVIVALLIVREPQPPFLVALVALVVAEVYSAGLLFLFLVVRRGDGNNFLPALLGAFVPLLAGFAMLFTGVLAPWGVVVLIVAWALALILLLVSLAMNRSEAAKADRPTDLTVRRGKA